METYLLDWLNLLVRWLHLITGIAWIGSSFYFVWLDNHLLPPNKPNEELQGEVWSVHGGGFYQAQKYRVAPQVMPSPLHWFKWEAYSTWISGTFLLALVYWYGAEIYLLDLSRADLSKAEAILIGAGGLLAGWIMYDLMCRSPLARNDRLLATAVTLLIAIAAYGFCQVFSGRGAFIHFGAMIGTIMVANVFFVIIPGQKLMVDSAMRGESPDPNPGLKAKQRSVHNTYLTLPVLFVMISNHYAFTYAGEYNWVNLLAIVLLGALIRVYFVSRHKANNKQLGTGAASVVPLLLAAGVLAGLIYAGIPALRTSPLSDSVSMDEIEAILQQHCVACHSAQPSQPGFTAPPLGVVFDTREEIKKQAQQIYQQSVVSKVMPIGNLTGMTDGERQKIASWIQSGNKLKTERSQ